MISHLFTAAAAAAEPNATKLHQFILFMVWNVAVWLVCYGAAGSFQSISTASTTMVAFIGSFEARQESKIPAPSLPYDNRMARGVNLPVISDPLHQQIVSPPIDIGPRQIHSLINYITSQPLIQNHQLSMKTSASSADTTKTQPIINTNNTLQIKHKSSHFFQFDPNFDQSYFPKHLPTPLPYTFHSHSTNMSTDTANDRAARRKAREEKAAKDAAKAAIFNPPEATSKEDEVMDDVSVKTTRVDGEEVLQEGWTFEDEETDKEKATPSNKTNDYINDMNQPSANATEMEQDEESTGKSPPKKRNKKSVLDEISTPKPTATAKTPKTATDPAAKSKQKGKRSASTMKEATDKENSSSTKSTSKSTTKGSGIKSALKAKPKFTRPEFKHEETIVEVTVDFKKQVFEQFDGDRCKAMEHAMKKLLENILISDSKAVICKVDNPKEVWIGEGGVKVPSNMTSLCNYCFGLNPKVFQAKGSSNNAESSGDNLESLGVPGNNQYGNSNKKNTTVAYFSILLSSMKDPAQLLSQVSFEWGKYGIYIRPKALQCMNTYTPFVFLFLHAQGSKYMIVDELKEIFEIIQNKMLNDDGTHDIPLEYSTQKVEDFTVRSAVIKLPKSNLHRKIDNKYAGMKRQWHLEIPSDKKAMFEALIAYGKKTRVFKEYWGPHVHPTECLTYESSPGDIKRCERLAGQSLNYNYSLTGSEMDGYRNLNNTVTIEKDGEVLATLTGRECLQSFYKLEDGSPLIAEVHQQPQSSSIYLVYPNTKEAECAINNLTKHGAGYSLFLLRAAGVAEDFIWKYLSEFYEAPLVHTAELCKWDEKSKTLLTPEEQEEDAADLESNSWFIDIIEKQDEKKSSGKKNGYAQKKALFDLDGEQSVKTMHEANDVVEIDDDEDEEEAEETGSLSSTQKAMQKKKHQKEEENLNSENVETVADEEEQYAYSDVEDGDEEMADQDGLQKEAGEEEDSTSKQSGNTPTSVGVRFPDNDAKMTSADHEESGHEEGTATEHASSGTGTGA